MNKEIKISGHKLLTDLIEEELSKCAKSPQYFYNKYFVSILNQKEVRISPHIGSEEEFNDIYYSALERKKLTNEKDN